MITQQALDPDGGRPTATDQQVLAPLSGAGARPLLLEARRHYRTMQRTGIRFAVDLRRLQDGAAHITYGYANFGAFAEREFYGLSRANAQLLSVQGNVALSLDRSGRIDLDGPDRDLPGTTALRPLAHLLNAYGEEAMFAVYDRARAVRPERPVVGKTVRQAEAELLSATVDASDIGEDRDDDDDYDSGDQPGDDEESEAIRELRDRVGVVLEQLRDLLDDAAYGRPVRARQKLRDTMAELDELDEALSQVEAESSSLAG
jgi:hypothetical protein